VAHLIEAFLAKVSGSLPFPKEFFFLVMEGKLIFYCTDQELLEVDG